MVSGEISLEPVDVVNHQVVLVQVLGDGDGSRDVPFCDKIVLESYRSLDVSQVFYQRRSLPPDIVQEGDHWRFPEEEEGPHQR